MANYTLTYSPMLEGWTSFHSYYPEWMTNMNNFLYTFKSGELWKHNTNQRRNNWYKNPALPPDPDPSTVTVVFNDAPSESKMFKTIACETDSPWKTTITTDLNSGVMEASYFELKEGDYFTYIRRNPNTVDYKALSTQGIGQVSSAIINPSTGFLDVFFAFEIPNTISVFDQTVIPKTGGDVLYCQIAGVQTLIGDIDQIVNDPLTGNKIVVKVPATIPNANDFAYAVKSAVAESYGARGYYMQVLLENTSSTAVELFAISSQVFKSYP
jgi:hypothetical protein